ncbi:MAG: sugar phosphate isomerase/epimerase [Candidatus Hydrogenedentes bacterium]|nr:sugar phosphate isomerase/epimerase [Candidatus Hydrogenedentota bacterium]
MTRRGFVAGSAAAAAALIVPASASSETRPPLACRLASYGKFQEAAWEHLPAIGIHYLFLNVPDEREVESMHARLVQHQLTPLVMRGAADLSSLTSVQELTLQLDTCHKMGVHYMFLSPKHGDAPKQAAIERLRELGDIAKARAVTITLETHRDLGTNADVHRETMQAIGHPSIRVNFDTGNITFYNHDRNAVDELKKIIDYVGTVELKDHNGGYESWEFPPLGTGKVDLKGVVQVMRQHAYTGPVTLEFEGVKGVELDEEGTKKAIEDSIKYIRSLGDFA